MSVSEFRERLKKLHSVIKGLIFTGLASVTFFIEQWLVGHSFSLKKDALEAYQLYGIDTYKGVAAVVFWAPIREEILYRGPVLIAVFVVQGLMLLRPESALLKRFLYGLCIAFGLVLNYLWAFSHVHHPYTIFVFGIIWGTCMILTRKLHYAIILHAGSNAIAVLGITLINYFSK